MKTFVYFSLPGYGHTNPTLNVARELVKRGHKVIFYSTKRFQPMIEDAGVTYRDYGFANEIDGKLSRNIGLFVRLLAELAAQKIPHMVADMKKEQPDCIIHDNLCAWGKIIGHASDVPTISLVTSAAYKKRSFLLFPRLFVKFFIRLLSNTLDITKTYWIYNKSAKPYGVKLNGLQDVVICNEKLNIVFSLKSFTPFPKSYNDSFYFVGPSIYPRIGKETFLKQIPKKTKIIYISYGTVINDDHAFFTACINALKDTPYHVVISLGDRFEPSDFPNLPANVTLKKYLNQLEVLERASVFITHAGMNSCMEGLFYGVPMLLIPDTEEQRFNALRVVGMGAGVFLKKRLMTETLLLQKTQLLLNEPKFLQKAKHMQEILHKEKGYIKAADKILSFLN